jgi:hypothetical protein
MELAVGEVGPDVADVAASFANEDCEAAPGWFRIPRRRNAIVAHECIAIVVERRAPRSNGFLERRQRLGRVDGDGLVGCGGLGAERSR